MELLINVPNWDEVERNLNQKFSGLNQSIHDGFQDASNSWNGFSRQVSNSATQAYGYVGGDRIDCVRLALARSYPIIQGTLKRKWASIEIEQISPVLMQLIKEIVMIVGGSMAIGTVVGGLAGSLALGAGTAPGALIGSGIGLQVGNLILMALGLAAIGEYFYSGLMPCLKTLDEGITIAWNAEAGLKPAGLDPTGASSAIKNERIERAAQQLSRG